MKAKLLIVMLILPLIVICQEKQAGLSMGINFGNWMGDDDAFAEALAYEMNYQEGFSGFNFDSKSRTGFSLGFFYDFPIKKAISIQPEISYSQKGAKFKGDGQFSYYGDYYTVKSDVIMRLDYLDVVVLGKYSLAESGVKPYFVAGLGLGYLISSQMKVKVTVDGESDSNTEKVDGYQKMEAHLNFGGGIDISESIRIDVRYALGLTSVVEDEDFKNGVVSLSLAACF